MTGRELIIYILQNHLEDEPVFKDGRFLGFLTVEEAAVVKNTGVETVRALAKLGMIPYAELGSTMYIPCNFNTSESKPV